MEIKFIHGEEMVVALVGRLDTITSVELDNALSKEEIKENLVVLDFKDLEYISSAGLRLVIKLKKELEAKGKGLVLENLNEVVKEVFKVTGFINVVKVR